MACDAPRTDAYCDAVRALVACFCFSVVTSSFYVWLVLLPALEASLGVRRAPLSAAWRSRSRLLLAAP